MLRLFVGIPLEDDIRRRIAVLCSGLPGVRWTAPENLHITLRFVGEIDEGLAEDLHHGLATIRAPAFALAFEGLGCFESGRQVRVIWAGLGRSEGLEFLHDKVESATVRAGLEPERRKFKPHLTLARPRDLNRGRFINWLQLRGDFRAGPVAVDRFVLFRSHLKREGPVYEELADYPLFG